MIPCAHAYMFVLVGKALMCNVGHTHTCAPCHACMHIFVHTIRFLQETMDLSEDTELTYDQVRVRVCLCVCLRERESESE
jgi:hypothetical protein